MFRTSWLMNNSAITCGWSSRLLEQSTWYHYEENIIIKKLLSSVSLILLVYNWFSFRATREIFYSDSMIKKLSCSYIYAPILNIQTYMAFFTSNHIDYHILHNINYLTCIWTWHKSSCTRSYCIMLYRRARICNSFWKTSNRTNNLRLKLLWPIRLKGY